MFVVKLFDFLDGKLYGRGWRRGRGREGVIIFYVYGLKLKIVVLIRNMNITSLNKALTDAIVMVGDESSVWTVGEKIGQ